MKQRQQSIERQILRTSTELQQQMHQLPQWTDQAQPPISSTALFKALETLVERVNVGCLLSLITIRLCYN